MQIAVLGGGNGSYAAAADLTEQGHEVRFWRRDAAAFAPVLAKQALTLKDAKGVREVKIACVTTDIGAAVRGAELIVIPTPAFSQDEIAQAMAPHLADGQVIFLPPGTFGSFAMMQQLRRHGCKADVILGETGTLPYLTRKHGPAEIAITVRAVRLPTGFFPTRHSERGFAVVSKAFPSIHLIEDALSAALMNGGPIIHPPLILMNAGPLEFQDRFDIHNEGTQPAVRRVTDALDEERIAVREALGYKPYHYPLRDTYSSDRWMYGDTHKVLVDSGDWREKINLTEHRYMTEDVHYGLSFLVSVANWAGVPAPTATGLLAIASAICGRDLANGPRTMTSLGLQKLSPQQMTDMLMKGAVA
ncbi:NAD/NADP octopine/nopaline dehydrogenase family protein [Bradyrhizobium jicamae]|uniref:NAD/NADP-dependent octopine/nopaline dehydrogenase family protein n=1 Tax=Bradyrhizobium jicamae TaxID=280332 RepID=UPI001BADFE78|nr:NAD/NADP-dependent octopine/nopaline dehydrogenase family protein [Bradyrhizobium jicamae]MBR0755422.1 NAD/NADP octopine/nopaline dehydrogenase family protein [Bradyrhizobium jicamae]